MENQPTNTAIYINDLKQLMGRGDSSPYAKI